MSRPRKPSLRDALAPVLARRGDPVQVERRRRALFGAEQFDGVPARIAAVLADGVPRTAPEIAKAITRRRARVEETLHRNPRFVSVPAPTGRSSHARTWVVASPGAGRVGTSDSGDAGAAS